MRKGKKSQKMYLELLRKNKITDKNIIRLGKTDLKYTFMASLGILIGCKRIHDVYLIGNFLAFH